MPKNLLQGFQNFINTHYHSDDALMKTLIADGQDPDYFIISCIDSRAHAGTVFQMPPGTYFAHKAMGAIVRPYRQGTALSAALQFAMIHNNVSTLIVMGHTGCGAVRALIDDIEDPEISSFIEVAKTALNRSKDKGADAECLQRVTEENIVKLSFENLKQYPSVRYRLNKGDLTVKAWLFDMHEGSLLEYDESSDQFQTIG